MVGMNDPERRLEAYPHELSGGMAQRVCLALALMYRPRLLVADEPTAGLDVTIQRQVLDLMQKLAQEAGTAQLIVTADLGIAAQYCDKVAVMRGGQIIEVNETRAFFDLPSHPYSKRLLVGCDGLRAAVNLRGAQHACALRTAREASPCLRSVKSVLLQ